MAESGYRQAPLLVRRSDGQTIQLTPLLYRVLEAIDGHRGRLEIAWEVATRTQRVLSADEVGFLIDEKLRPLGLVTMQDGTEPVVNRVNPLLALRLRFVVTNPRITNIITKPFARLFHPAIVVPVILAFAGVTAWVLVVEGLGGALHHALYEPRFLLLVFALTVLSAAFHEVGHAAACRYGGAQPGAMGGALYLVWPAFYTDVSDSYRLDRRSRLRVDLGGLYFNAIFAVGTFLTWALIRSDALLVMVPIQLFQMVRQLLPLVRFDGYHILADLTGVPDLFARIRPTLIGLLPQHWGKEESKVLKPWVRVVVTSWVLVVVPALAACLVMMVLAFPRILATASDSLGLQFGVLRENLAEGNMTSVAVRLVSLVAIALPPLSIAYLLSRITRRTSRRIWQVAEGHPVARGMAATALASVVAFFVLALWPGGQYVPVTGTERAAAADGFGIIVGPLIAPAPVPTGDGGRSPTEVAGAPAPPANAGGIRSGRNAPVHRPAEPLIAGQEALELPRRPEALVELDSASSGRSPWPFPFAPPPPPRHGDNFAVAVNVIDRNRVSILNASMLWLNDARVDQRNRSYALASCSDCTTVAAAFQVIVANARTATAVPENTAVAVNYECTTCVTHSISVQLVVTTVHTPPVEVRRRVESLFAVAESLEARAHQVPSEVLRERLLEVKASILELLAPYASAVTSSEHADGDQAAADAATVEDASASTSTTTTTPSTTTTTPSTTTTTPSTTTTTTPSTTTTTPSTTTTTNASTTTSTTTTTTTTTTTSTTTTTTTSTTTTTPSTTTTTARQEEPDP